MVISYIGFANDPPAPKNVAHFKIYKNWLENLTTFTFKVESQFKTFIQLSFDIRKDRFTERILNISYRIENEFFVAK